MAFDLERLTGFILDLCGGDGGPALRAAMRCPVCAGPIACRIRQTASTLTVSCITDTAHFHWRGVYLGLPGWLRSDDTLQEPQGDHP